MPWMLELNEYLPFFPVSNGPKNIKDEELNELYSNM